MTKVKFHIAMHDDLLASIDVRKSYDFLCGKHRKRFNIKRHDRRVQAWRETGAPPVLCKRCCEVQERMERTGYGLPLADEPATVQEMRNRSNGSWSYTTNTTTTAGYGGRP